ncbi:hypothetical protein ACFL0I_02780, partial [Gemmatimonadota bacterium]
SELFGEGKALELLQDPGRGGGRAFVRIHSKTSPDVGWNAPPRIGGYSPQTYLLPNRGMKYAMVKNN